MAAKIDLLKVISTLNQLYQVDFDDLSFNSHVVKCAEFIFHLFGIQDGGHFQDGGHYRPKNSIFSHEIVCTWVIVIILISILMPSSVLNLNVIWSQFKMAAIFKMAAVIGLPKVYLPLNGQYLADFDKLSVNYHVWKGAEFISASLIN